MKLKNLLANNNVVTILGAILIVVVLYVFYNWRVNQAINPISVPYAKVAIPPRTRITSDMIGYLDIQQAAMRGNVLTNAESQIIDHYTNVNSKIPEGSLFYGDVVVRKEELADSFMLEIPEGMIPYNFRVDVMSTYGNSIYPGNYVNMYFKGVQDEKIVLGKLITNVKVLAVKDSNGNSVFEADDRTPSQIIFAVTEEMSRLLRATEYISNAELILVPTTVDIEGEEKVDTIITDEEIKDYIEKNMNN